MTLNMLGPTYVEVLSYLHRRCQPIFVESIAEVRAAVESPLLVIQRAQLLLRFFHTLGREIRMPECQPLDRVLVGRGRVGASISR